MWRTANRHRLRTVGDFLELRYGATTRAVLTGLLLVATLFVLAAQLLAAGVLIGEVADIPLPLGILFSAGVMTAYFIAGGLASAAVVNLAQLVVLVVGLAWSRPGRSWRRAALTECARLSATARWMCSGAARWRSGICAPRSRVPRLPRHLAEAVRRPERAGGASRAGVGRGGAPPVRAGPAADRRRGRRPSTPISVRRTPRYRRFSSRRCRCGSGVSGWRRSSPPRSRAPTRSCSCCPRRSPATSTSAGSGRRRTTAPCSGRRAGRRSSPASSRSGLRWGPRASSRP